MNPTNLYDLDLRALGVKDRELARLIAEVKRLRGRRADFEVAAEEARRNLATLPDRLRDSAAAAISAGDDPADEDDVIAETERAATIAETRAAGAAAALTDAERAVERHLDGLGSTHRATVRETSLPKHKTAALEAVDDVVGKVDRVLDDHVALLQLQPLPVAGRGGVLPSQDRRYLGREYAQHRLRDLLREVREEVEALVPPSEEAFHDAVSSTPGYLHRPPKDRDGFIITTPVRS